MLHQDQSLTNVEEQIKKAAKKVFLKKGLAGSRLQEIADEANIGRTALHYYYRSKENLFEVVFSEAFKEMQQRMSELLSPDLPALEKMKIFVTGYFERAVANPDIDFFIINEYNQNPEVMGKVLFENNLGGKAALFIKEISDSVAKGELVGDPKHIFLTMLSLCIYPIVARSLLQSLLQYTDEDYAEFIEQWKGHVIQVLGTSFCR